MTEAETVAAYYWHCKLLFGTQKRCVCATCQEARRILAPHWRKQAERFMGGITT